MNLATYKNMLVWWNTKTPTTNKGTFNEQLYLKILKKRGMKRELDIISLFQFTLHQI